MREPISLDVLRRHPVEWRRRGLTPPSELDALVAARIAGYERSAAPAEPAYADFFAVA
jgi:hypothetical protein